MVPKGKLLRIPDIAVILGAAYRDYTWEFINLPAERAHRLICRRGGQYTTVLISDIQMASYAPGAAELVLLNAEQLRRALDERLLDQSPSPSPEQPKPDLGPRRKATKRKPRRG